MSVKFSIASFTRLNNVVKSNTQKLSTNVSKMSTALERHSSEETTTSWDKVKHLLDTSTKLVENTSNHLKKMKDMFLGSEVTDMLIEKRELEELETEFEKVINSFTHIQNRAIDIEKKMIADAADNCRNQAAGDSTVPMSEHQQQQQQLLTSNVNQQDVDELQKRKDDLEKLESSVMMVNEIFKDIHNLAAEQGEHIDRIDENIEQANVKVEIGVSNLEEAVENQKKSRKRKFMCAGIAVVIAIILVVVIALSFQ